MSQIKDMIIQCSQKAFQKYTYCSKNYTYSIWNWSENKGLGGLTLLVMHIQPITLVTNLH